MKQSLANGTKSILIVDDEAPVVKALALRCELLGLSVEKAYDAAEALAHMQRSSQRPDLLLLDYSMPGVDGLSLCEMLKADMTMAPIPVILLTGYDNDETRRRCLEMGSHFVKKDVNAWENLQPLIRRLLGLEATEEVEPPAATRSDVPQGAALPGDEAVKRILIIDDDPAVAKGLKVRLEAAGLKVRAAYTGMQGYWMALKEEPHLVVLDYKMPEGWGNTILGKLKSNPLTRDIPVIILSGMTDLGVQRDVVRLGAECWVNKPFDMREFVGLVQDTLSRSGVV